MASIVQAQLEMVEKHLNVMLGLFEFVVIRTVNGTEYEFSKEGKSFSLKKVSANRGGFVQPGEVFKVEGWNFRNEEGIHILVVGEREVYQTGPLQEIVIPFV
ncbi:MAG TPA: hypothetical protein VLE47_03440 [Candidatus Saccharimonadales bacterium]|nr:hypothetical protein [Candidatus Saccharimonadales bacterium]